MHCVRFLHILFIVKSVYSLESDHELFGVKGCIEGNK